jgi:hypothetical protein
MSSPPKFQLPKFLGKKDISSKDKSDKLALVYGSYEEGRLRAASCSLVTPNNDGKDSVKPRASSLLASPTKQAQQVAKN